ncbi:MAG: biopolymer transporter ExbD [Oligoflexia bacterium]|nr:biopolymer transporter ExbD [Oligoflexia bacterium]
MSAGGLGGGKKGVSADLNLVPFIDLFSTLICFLLITAVWQQIAVLSTQGSAPTDNVNNTALPDKKVDLSVSLFLDHLLIGEGSANVKIPHNTGNPDYEALKKKLAEWKLKYPNRSDLVLNTDSQAPYKHLIHLMDTMTSELFGEVSINTN